MQLSMNAVAEHGIFGISIVETGVGENDRIKTNDLRAGLVPVQNGTQAQRQ
jgi:hypothetical protein